jgi:hypothetical protein
MGLGSDGAQGLKVRRAGSSLRRSETRLPLSGLPPDDLVFFIDAKEAAVHLGISVEQVYTYLRRLRDPRHEPVLEVAREYVPTAGPGTTSGLVRFRVESRCPGRSAGGLDPPPRRRHSGGAKGADDGKRVQAQGPTRTTSPRTSMKSVGGGSGARAPRIEARGRAHRAEVGSRRPAPRRGRGRPRRRPSRAGEQAETGRRARRRLHRELRALRSGRGPTPRTSAATSSASSPTLASADSATSRPERLERYLHALTVERATGERDDEDAPDSGDGSAASARTRNAVPGVRVRVSRVVACRPTASPPTRSATSSQPMSGPTAGACVEPSPTR